MGQKVSPISFRLGGLQTWRSKWLAKGKDYRVFLEEDVRMRDFILNKLKEAAIARIDIERSPNMINVVIISARPGIIIGRGGTGIDDLKRELQKLTHNKPLKVSVEEVQNPESNAALVARTVAEAIEKRIPFRRVIKQALDRTRDNRGVKGVKIMVAGRLNGTTMSRREWVSWGEIPLHNLRADIDFVKDVARTKYGIIGIKIWIYKGEVFEGEKPEEAKKKS